MELNQLLAKVWLLGKEKDKWKSKFLGKEIYRKALHWYEVKWKQTAEVMKDNGYMDSGDTSKEQELALTYDHSQDEGHLLCGISVTLKQKCMYVSFCIFFFFFKDSREIILVNFHSLFPWMIPLQQIFFNSSQIKSVIFVPLIWLSMSLFHSKWFPLV